MIRQYKSGSFDIYKPEVDWTGPTPYKGGGPSDLPNFYLWLDASQEAYSNGAAVTSLTDFSGRGMNMVQTTSSAQPTFVTGSVNGKPAVVFDGTSDFLENKTNTPMSGGMFVAAVYRIVNGAGANAGIFCGSEGGNDYGGGNVFHITTGWGGNISTPSGQNCGWRGAAMSQNIVTSTGSYFLYTYNIKDIGAGSCQLCMKKAGVVTQLTGFTSSPHCGPNRWYIGARPAPAIGNYGKIELAEMLVYTGSVTLDGGITASIETYLGTKYGVSY
jgi:hypothetical protein